MKPHEPLNAMLEKFVKIGASMQEAAQLTCPQCGITFGEFRQHGLLGCPNDYEVFKDLLMPLIERAHGGATDHAGKRPGASGKLSVRMLHKSRIRRELEQAVADEDYEQAARLRDQLAAFDAEDRDER